MKQVSFFDGAKPYKINKPIRLIEFFAGYGSQSLALKYLGVDFVHWKICEWAVKSIQAYKDCHFESNNTDYFANYKKEDLIKILLQAGISIDYNTPMTEDQIKRKSIDWLKQVANNILATNNLVNIQNVKGEDLLITETNKYTYILTYSFPCQDLSKAGKLKGMGKDSGTRSGMLWEVERILEELNGNLPQVLLMENVPDVIGTKNKVNFGNWTQKLEALGYKNYYANLNAKNYGVPQNRERVFMVSLLGDYDYQFPHKVKLHKTLKDMLEENVDEKYYLSDKAIKYALDLDDVQKGTKWEGSTANATLNKPVAMTISCRGAESQRAGITNFIIDNVESEISVKKIKQEISLVKTAANKIIESGKVEEGDFFDVSYSNSRINELKENKSLKTKNSQNNKLAPTLTTNAGNNYGMVVKDSNNIIKVGNYMPSNHNASVVVHKNGIAPTVMENHGTVTAVLEEKTLLQNLRIRKLTPKECFRLMGVKDADYEKIAKNQSNASLYHLAGDSIVVNVLMAIFKNLL
jgi:DNA (cytosine-5)-methyltransferase 1